MRPFVPAPTAGRNVNRYYRVEENAARLEAGFAAAAAATGLKVDALADALSKSTTELPEGDMQKLLDTSYRGLVQELQQVHGRLKKEDAAAAKRLAEVAAGTKANRGVPGGARVAVEGHVEGRGVPGGARRTVEGDHEGCGRAEANFLTKQGHELHCAYVPCACWIAGPTRPATTVSGR